MGCRQAISTIRLVDIEALRALNALQMSKAFEWDLAGAGDELEQLRLLRLIKRTNGTPPPLHNCIAGTVPMQFRIVLPRIHVNVWQAGDEQFEFLLAKDANKLIRNDVVETLEEGIDLEEAKE